MEKKKLTILVMLLVTTLSFAAGTKRISAIKDRRCNQVVIVNKSSKTVRIAWADGVDVTGWIKSGQKSSLNVNKFVLEIGNNCSASASISGRNYIVTITGGSSNSYSGSSNSSSSSSSVSNNRCTHCRGDGDCYHCYGKGRLYREHRYNRNDRYVKCNSCNGSGKCHFCRGTGKR